MQALIVNTNHSPGGPRKAQIGESGINLININEMLKKNDKIH